MTTAPYDLLYIYYLEGRISPARERDLRHFLGNWEEEGQTFLFFSQPARDQVDALLGALPDLRLLDAFEMPYDQWQGAVLDAEQIGRFQVVPPWRANSSNGPSPTRILMDPGVVFGNGTHATTRDCMAALECIAGEGPPGFALDLGTGTGILAMAAVRLGCRRCLAVDYNFLAARTARANAIRNEMADTVLVCQARAEDFAAIPADVLIANIHYDVMRRIVRTPGFFDKTFFVLSGLMTREALDIENTLAHSPVEVLRHWERDGGWHTFLGKTRTKRT